MVVNYPPENSNPVKYEFCRVAPLRLSLTLMMLAMTSRVWTQQDAAAVVDTMEATLEAVTISAGALPVQLRNATRAVEVIDARALEAAAPFSIDDALRVFSGAWVQRRGPYGMQSDVSMRGGTFGQTLLMIDGLRVSDPQTGHHALQIPLALSMIERIEVLPGHGSAFLGADALGGAVNIVPSREPTARLGASFEAGSFGLLRGGLDAAYGSELLPSHTAAEYRSSDGWRKGTEFVMLSLSHLSRLAMRGGELTLLGGYADRDFGAFDFYSPGRGIPSHERIRSGYAALGGRAEVGGMQLRASVTYRDLRDRFHFDTRIPDRYINEHHTQVLGADMRGMLSVTKEAALSIGIEAAADRITSSSLGDHHREWLAPSAAAQWRIAPWLEMDGGLRLDVHRDFHAQWNPSAGLLLRVSESFAVRASAGRSFRVPTYTDLYYSDPVNKGNAALQPESAWSAEAGLEWEPRPRLALSATVFRRDQRDLIDYVQRGEADPFIAMNFASAVVTGTELRIRWSASLPAFLDHAQCSYAALSTQLDSRSAFRIRYAFSSPSHLLTLRIGGHLATIEWHATLIAADQQLARDYLTLDTRLQRSLGAFGLFLAVDNLTNSAIEEFPGLPLPGRWLRGGIEFAL